MNEGRTPHATSGNAANTGGRSRSMPSQRYQFRVKGHLDASWSEWFDGSEIALAGDGTTLLTSVIADQSALHGLLARIRDLNLTLLSLQQIDT